MNNTEGDFMENRIKRLRKEAGISQKKLGDELGVAQTTISQIHEISYHLQPVKCSYLDRVSNEHLMKYQLPYIV